MKTALMHRVRAIGDVIFAEPFARALRKHGYEQVYVSTEFPEVFLNHPGVTGTNANPPCTYDVFDLTDVYERQLERLVPDAYLSCYGLSLPAAEKVPKIWLTEEEKAQARLLLGPGPWVVINIGYPRLLTVNRAFWSGEQWHPLLKSIKDLGYKIVVVGRDEQESLHPIDRDLRHQTTLRQLFAIIEACDYMIGIDSGPLNVAQAVGTKGVGLYCAFQLPNALVIPGSGIMPVRFPGPPAPFHWEKVLEVFQSLLVSEKGCIEIDNDSEFEATVNALVNKYHIEEIVETGSYLGTGSTRALAQTGLPVTTIECHPRYHALATRNLAEYPNVTVRHGYSLPRNEMRSTLEQEDYWFKNHPKLKEDVPGHAAYNFYRSEIDHGPLAENLLTHCLNDRRQLVFLDSAGFAGWAEFQRVLPYPKKITILNDVNHLKHFRSVQYLRSNQHPVYFASSRQWAWCMLNW